LVNLDTEVRSSLLSDTDILMLLGGPKVYRPNQPGDTKNQFPAVVFEEISNVPAISADNLEYASRITYRVLAYVKGVSITPLLNAVEKAMLSVGFTRHSSGNIYNLPPEVRGKEILFITMREC
jgi:hypothetical protein